MINSDNNASKRNIDDNVLDYIKKELKRGVSKELIKANLVRVGHNPSHLDLHFRLLENKNLSKLLSYFLIFFVILFVLSGIANVVLYNKVTLKQRYDELVFEAKDLCTKGDFNSGLKKLEKAMKLNNRNAFAYAIYGHCYLLQGKNTEVVGFLNEAVKREAGEPLYFYRLGAAYCSLKNYNLGIANLQRSLQLDPSNAEVNKAIADCYSKAGNQEEAKKYLEIANKAKS